MAQPELYQKYHEKILPGYFSTPYMRFTWFITQKIHAIGLELTFENVMMWLRKEKDSEAVKQFTMKHKISKPYSATEFARIIVLKDAYDLDEYFAEQAFSSLLDATYVRFTNMVAKEIIYYGEHSDVKSIAPRAKAILTMRNHLYLDKREENDALHKAMERVNSNDETIPTCLKSLNEYIGGFSRGYVATVIAKSSHNKSTFSDFNAVVTLAKGYAEKAVIITTEELAEVKWRRVIAMINKLSLTELRMKRLQITEEHLKAVKDKLGSRLVIKDNLIKHSHITEFLMDTNADLVVLDHINSIQYSKGSGMQAMIDGIPEIVLSAKSAAKKHNNVIMVLSQVNDKDIQRDSNRLIKAPRYWDAYGGSSLYHASREFLALWYPYKEQEDVPMASYSDKDVQIGIEKSSYTGVGKFMVEYLPEYATFLDRATVYDSIHKTRQKNANNLKQENLW